MARKRRNPNRQKDAKEGGVNPAPVAHISDPSGLDPNMGPGQRRFYSKPKPAAPAQIEKADPADLYAALDLGTNSCRMLIAQPKG
ncbi:MAG: hypothetical protein ACO2ZI_09310, partial [Paracoccaceae bacterium]